MREFFTSDDTIGEPGARPDQDTRQDYHTILENAELTRQAGHPPGMTKKERKSKSRQLQRELARQEKAMLLESG